MTSFTLRWTKDPPEDERRIRDEDFPNFVAKNTEREFYERMKNPVTSAEMAKRGAFDSKYYSKEKGFDRDFISWWRWDYEVDDTDLMVMRYRNRNIRIIKEKQA